MARCERTFIARPENVAAARRAMAALAREWGVPEPALDDVRLAVSEAMSNAVVHGYRHGDAGRVTVLADADDSRLRIVVRDEGCGMSPHLDSGGAGLGLPLIAQLTDSLAVRPAGPGQGTELCMTFRLAVAATA